MAPWSSIRLFVVAGTPPLNSLQSSPQDNTAAHPPGPGLPWQPPSVWIVTLFNRR